jgi:protoporphyrinogen oxidase
VILCSRAREVAAAQLARRRDLGAPCRAARRVLPLQDRQRPPPPARPLTDPSALRPLPPPPAQVGVLIVGAGPTGLGAATRLHQLGHPSWLLADAAAEAGGLACTDTTREGFLFDMGGHVIFSHYAYFDDLIDAAIGAGGAAWNTLERVSYVWLKGRWVAYPFQNNISALDKEDQVACLTGAIEAKVANAVAGGAKPKNFDEWIMRVMGAGIADLFMRPYNFKVWATPPAEMQCEWLGERVATVDVSRAVANVIHGREDAGWGPNAVFRFPRRGGTGAIWKAVAALLPAERQRYGARVASIDAAAKTAIFEDGRKVAYDALITTVPLDTTLTWLGKADLAAGLVHSSSHIVGLGLRGACPHGLKCWLYFPEDDCPFYRVTVFSHYAEENCPATDVALPTLCRADGGDPPAGSDAATPGPYWSLMFEISESSQKPVAQDSVAIGGAAGAWPRVVLDTLAGAVATKLVAPGDEVVSVYHRRIEHGYPTPSVGRDAVLKEALPLLRKEGIWSRGRFGAWKYEVANQDHSLMLGVEAVDNVLFGTQELTLEFPNVVNPRKNTELRYSAEAVMPGLLAKKAALH